MKVTIVDMQPIEPPVGGGRLRLLGLYHDLGLHFSSTYVGSYDWPGEQKRRLNLSQTLTEITVPLSQAHFEAAARLQEEVEGKTIIDIAFSEQGILSQEYLATVKQELEHAEVIVFSHPWVYPLVENNLSSAQQLIIYDAQNVEGFLRASLLLGDNPKANHLVERVVQDEYNLCSRADYIFACSLEDKLLFHEIYAIPLNKIIIVPNGVFTQKIIPADAEQRKRARKSLGLNADFTALFLASNYAPNVEAAQFIIEQLAPELDNINLIIAGGVGDVFMGRNLPSNIKLTGQISEEQKLLYLQAADIALNPMFSGSGTNIKMFDFMAAGLPIISTQTGSRGIHFNKDSNPILEANDANSFIRHIQQLQFDPSARTSLSKDVRQRVEDYFSWEKISISLGALITKLFALKQQPAKKLAIMSSFGVCCGIGEYTAYLVDGFNQLDEPIDISLITTYEYGYQTENMLHDKIQSFCPAWHFDNKTWTASHVDIAKIVQFLQLNQIEHFNIQYHPGFFSEGVLVELCKRVSNLNINTSVVVHNLTEAEQQSLVELINLKVKVVVHSQAEADEFCQQQGLTIGVVPHGLNVNSWAEQVNLDDHPHSSPIVGTFGFLRTYKGLLELIEAIALLRKKYPSLKLKALTSLYPSDDSADYYQECLDLIRARDLVGAIEINTDFLAIPAIIKLLHECDINVLPYHKSSEGSSAAARTAIASYKPTLVTPSRIFANLQGVTYPIQGFSASDIAKAIDEILSDRALWLDYQARAERFAKENTWPKVAKFYYDTWLTKASR